MNFKMFENTYTRRQEWIPVGDLEDSVDFKFVNSMLALSEFILETFKFTISLD